MPPKSPRNLLNFSVQKKKKSVTSKEVAAKRKITHDSDIDSECENKVPRINESTDPPSSIKDELKKIDDALSSFVADDFVERNEQIEVIQDHLNTCIKQKESISIYALGYSGTGKTVALRYLREQKNIQKNFIVVFINCWEHEYRPANVYQDIIKNLGGDVKMNKTKSNIVDVMTDVIRRQRKPVLLILDNVDKLIQVRKKYQEMLYSLFELPSNLPNGQIALLTTGNLILLVDFYLPRLKAIGFKKPVTVRFPKYTARDITNVITKRLNKVNLKNIVIEKDSLELLGRKAAALCGDAREALQLAKKVFAKCVQDYIKSNGVCNIWPEEVQRVATYFLNEEDKIESLKTLTRDETLIVCAILLIIKDRKFDRTTLSIRMIEEMYGKICEKFRFRHSANFMNLLMVTECTGIFSVSSKKIVKDRSCIVTFEWNEEDVFNALSERTCYGAVLKTVYK